jgi:hypothetical protein
MGLAEISRFWTKNPKIYANLGDTGKAISFYVQSLAMSKEIGDKAAENATTNNISELMSYLNNLHSSQQDTGDKTGEGATLNDISTRRCGRRPWPGAKWLG